MPITPDSVIGWKKAGGRPLVCCSGDSESRPIAYAELNPMRNEPAHWWLGHVVVDPNRRGCGVGREFLRMLVDHASKQLGASRLSLIVFPENQAAIRCYQAVGFQVVCEEFHQFGGLVPKQRLLRLELHA
jgi:RimJ/RimL family protein N-acetyltransferase